jgi:hypothetical protein
LKQRFNQEDKFFIGVYLPVVKELANCSLANTAGTEAVPRQMPDCASQSVQPPGNIQNRAGPENQTHSVCKLAGEKGQHQHAVTEEVMAQAVWLKPEQPAEIEFVERTPHGRLRHASFRRLLPRSGEK